MSSNLTSVCTFHGQQTSNKKSCSIDYWLKEDKTCISNSASVTSQTSYNTSNVVTIGLPLSSLSRGQYCFSMIGDNGTYVLEGMFDIGEGIVHIHGITPDATIILIL